MRAFFKGVLLIVCLLIVLGTVLDRQNPPIAPLMILGLASAVILAVTLLLRRLVPRLGPWPARVGLVGGLIMLVWGGSIMRTATGWDALGGVGLLAIGLLLLISSGFVTLVAWMVDDRHPPPD